MSEYTVGDVSHDPNGELEQFLLFWDDGMPETRRATPENVLLFDPEDKLPFDGGMQSFFEGENAVKISDDPEIIIDQSGDEYTYVIAVDGDIIETTPSDAEDVLDGVYKSLAEDENRKIMATYEKIKKTQVRRNVINPLKKTFASHDRINIAANGWLIDGFYLVDWSASIYVDSDNIDEPDYIRQSGSVVEADKTYEFVQLKREFGESIDCQTIRIGGSSYTLTEREMIFLSKVTWLLDRETYHPDDAFWGYADRWADVPSSEPDLDSFNL